MLKFLTRMVQVLQDPALAIRQKNEDINLSLSLMAIKATEPVNLRIWASFKNILKLLSALSTGVLLAGSFVLAAPGQLSFKAFPSLFHFNWVKVYRSVQLEYRLTVMVMTDDNDVDVDGKLMVVVLMAMAVMLVWIVVMMVRLTAQLLMNDDASSHVLDIGSSRL